MKFEIVKITKIIVVSDSGKRYLVQRVKRESGKWVYKIMQIEGDRVVAGLGEVTVIIPAVIAVQAKEKIIQEAIENKIVGAEKEMQIQNSSC
jgi:transcriptional regulator CtsR